MPSIIAGDLVTSSLRLIGAIATNETPSANEMADALLVLNDLLESLSTESLPLYSTTDVTYPFTLGVSTYTLGPSGTWAGPRPIQIIYGYTRWQGVDYPCEITTDVERYNGISVKSVQTTVPMIALYNPEWPNGELRVWPVPSQAGATFTYTYADPLSQVANSGATITYPPGYSKMLRYRLGVELAPEYGIASSPDIIATAKEATANIKRANLQNAQMTCGVELVGVSPGPGLANFLSGNI